MQNQGSAGSAVVSDHTNHSKHPVEPKSISGTQPDYAFFGFFACRPSIFQTADWNNENPIFAFIAIFYARNDDF